MAIIGRSLALTVSTAIRRSSDSDRAIRISVSYNHILLKPGTLDPVDSLQECQYRDPHDERHFSRLFHR
jgi:hypothetical protein